MNKTTEDMYEVREVSKTKKPYRLYVDSRDWINDYETEKEALDALEQWIDDNGLENFANGLEYVFDNAFVCKIIKMKQVVKIK